MWFVATAGGLFFKQGGGRSTYKAVHRGGGGVGANEAHREGGLAR